MFSLFHVFSAVYLSDVWSSLSAASYQPVLITTLSRGKVSSNWIHPVPAVFVQILTMMVLKSNDYELFTPVTKTNHPQIRKSILSLILISTVDLHVFTSVAHTVCVDAESEPEVV